MFRHCEAGVAQCHQKLGIVAKAEQADGFVPVQTAL
jgi:hypothetical protein